MEEMLHKVVVREEDVVIPTYEIREYDKNPMFLEKRVYQGSSGRVYPHPVCEGVSDEKTDKTYRAVFLENDYILVMILPEIGGRIQRLYDKTNGYDAVYYNEVIKPALVGLAGPWISGGIEFNWPQHHRPSTFDLVDYVIVRNADGSVSVVTGETEKMFHTKGEATFTLYPDKAYLEIGGRVYNPTERPQTFLWWANPAVSVNNDTRTIFPPDVNAVFDHGKRDVSEFPIAKGVYYKVNYAPGTDISRYKNIPVPTSYMANKSDYDFIGNYDDAKEAGLLHVAEHRVSPGKKQWTWGNGDFGRAWDRNLTDENGPYIELMTGVFTDNQPDFTYLKPYEEKTFTQYFMPYKACGAISNAYKDLAVSVLKKDGGCEITVYSPAFHNDVTLKAGFGDETVFEKTFSIRPSEYVRFTAADGRIADIGGFFEVIENGDTVLSYRGAKNADPVPSPASAMQEPADVPSLEELYLDGMHLEQYRHATYNPADYYLEGLKRDPSDIRINNAYGKLLFKKGRAEESLKYFEAAIKKSTFRNPNPYDCEPYFNYGLSLLALGRTEKAYDAFYKAVWDGNIAGKAFYRLALIESKKGNAVKALNFVNEALLRGAHNYMACTLKTSLLRHMGLKNDALAFAEETLATDALEAGALYEKYLLTGNKEAFSRIRHDWQDVTGLALCYADAGFTEEAADILKTGNSNEPMIGYYLFMYTGDGCYLSSAEKAPSLYCFPNRLDDVAVLENAVKHGGKMAAYYLGCLKYDAGEWQDAVRRWESVKDAISLPTVHRNLALAYFNKLHDEKRALAEMEKAFESDTSDARILFELDKLYEILEKSTDERLGFLEKHADILATRDDLYTEYISLLNASGRYDKAFDLIEGHKFHPWEGGEGKISAEYRKSLMKKAEHAGSHEVSESYLLKALIYPENLGEGKLIGALDNDLYYLLGLNASDEEKKREYFGLAARGEDNFSANMYYNDQPPEMTYYRALALNRLGRRDDAAKIADAMIAYGTSHMDDNVKPDYFAVSLPDFLVFEKDLCKKNRKHCENMIKLGKAILEEIG